MKKKKIKLRYKKERVLFSDVLPYELPIIFSNRYFYRFLVKNGVEIDIYSEKGKIKNTLKWDKDIDEGALALLAVIFQKNYKELKNIDKVEVTDNLKSIPFIYPIQHKPTKHRFLSLIHPANQIKVVEFYNKYKDTILYLCSKSNFSMRYPDKVASYIFYKDRLHYILLGKKTDKIEMFFSEYENVKTFFSYQRYTNIYKFYEDYRYQRAEKKFSKLLRMDIQSCFDSIYTHSISWAINGGVDSYKDNFQGSDGSVGELWDKMMQEMNYNETNGIVIGPEFSRIFAEVILQHIDQYVENQLLLKGYRYKVDYECYRYVDDIFFFYNNEDVRIVTQQLFQAKMREFKLTISQEKTSIFERPFITDITKAKIEIDKLLEESLKLHFGDNKSSINQEEEEDADILDRDEVPIVNDQKLQEAMETSIYFSMKANEFNKKFKAIVSNNNVEMKDILNYTIARISIKLERILKRYDIIYKILSFSLNLNSTKHKKIREKKDRLERILSKFLFEVIDSVFFLYTNNKKINTTLKVIQILNLCIIYLDNKYTEQGKEKKEINRFSEYAREIVFKKIRDEISLVFQTAPLDENVQLETLYFLITLRSMNCKYQLQKEELIKYLRVRFDEKEAKLQYPTLNAISVIILIYYFGGIKKYSELKRSLIEQTLEKIKKIPEKRLQQSAEYIIFALDMVACPYILDCQKYKFLKKIGLSKNEFLLVKKYMKQQKFIFTKWTGIDITKELNAKISQEVYS